jgi:hypothetical protein
LARHSRVLRNIFVVLTVLLVTNGQSSSAHVKKTVHNLKAWSTWGHEGHEDGRDHGYVLSEDTPSTAAGKKSAKLQSLLPEQKGSFVSILQDVSPKLYLGKKVCFSASIKTDKVIGSAELWLLDQNGDRVLSFDDMADRAPSGTTDWRDYSIVIDVPNDSRKIRFGFMLNGGGTAWMKNPRLQLATAKQSSTARSFDATKFKLNQLNEHPDNLNFDDKSVVMDSKTDGVSQWSVHTDHGFHVYVDQEQLFKEKPSVQADCTSQSSDGFGSLYQSFSAAKYRNKRVSFSGFIKSTASSDWTTLFMQVDAPDHIVSFDAMENRQLKDLKDWKQASIVLDIPPESTKIKIGFLHTGVGKAWLSNCAFETVSNDIAVTNKPGAIEKFPQEKLPLKPTMSFD